MKNFIEIERDGRTPSRIVIDEASKCLPSLLNGRTPIIITDINLERRYPELTSSFEHITIGLGEEIKTLDTVSYIYRCLMEKGADRSSYLLGIGGGIVTDITGFVASTYMRGIGFGFIATTLLAQVDASVGGKNGVNVDGYKNMVGCFNQPDFVICDPVMLSTLPEREVRSGMAEAIKAGLIKSAELFDFFGAGYDTIVSNRNLLEKIIAGSIEIKAAVVKADFKESGERKKLNFGHTIAHAIEKSTRRYLHGEAVAIGCVHAAQISNRMGLLSDEEVSQIKSVIEGVGLPTECGIDNKTLFDALHMDKKRHGDKISFVALEKIGKCRIVELKFDELAKLMNV